MANSTVKAAHARLVADGSPFNADILFSEIKRLEAEVAQLRATATERLADLNTALNVLRLSGDIEIFRKLKHDRLATLREGRDDDTNL